jgi:hypothetical protein
MEKFRPMSGTFRSEIGKIQVLYWEIQAYVRDLQIGNRKMQVINGALRSGTGKFSSVPRTLSPMEYLDK